MKMLTKSLLLTTVMVFSAPAMACPADGGGQGKGMKHDPVKRFEMLKKRLDLTEQQIAQLQPIVDKQVSHKGSREDRRAFHKKLRETVKSGADQSQINNLADQAADKARTRILLKAEMMSKMNQVLTSEQLKKLEKHKKKQ